MNISIRISIPESIDDEFSQGEICVNPSADWVVNSSTTRSQIKTLTN